MSGTSQQVLGRFLESLVDDAREISKAMSDEFVAVEHLLLALARDERFGKGLMVDLGVTYANLEVAIITLRRGENVNDQDAEGKYEALKKYSRDLTEEARLGKLDPVIGRDDEIRRAIQILSRRSKNNPVLIGEPGVGKTAAVNFSTSSTRAPDESC